MRRTPWLNPVAIDRIAPAPGDTLIAIEAPMKANHSCNSTPEVWQ
ncbi:hypothetical protein MCNF_24450 [Mycolicibacterium confluentis]|uniref:Uncharacterized protein n=1 Tax=Mycolicibacterium confluentis TaxID=28047 RepID=A0A7I7XWZ9_9MYCO|nr:hypothetical protein MCNF_24450 [Mycolicibacterium confluentis]